MMEWINKVKQDYEEILGCSVPRDDSVLEVLINGTSDLTPKIKKQIKLGLLEYKKLLKQYKEYEKCGRVILWDDSMISTMSCLFVLHGYAWRVMIILKAFNGIHPTAPGAVWMAMKKILEDTPKAQRKNILSSVDMDAVENATLCDDVKEIWSRYVDLVERLKKFQVNMCDGINVVTRYMKTYRHSAPPNDVIENVNVEIKEIISDMMIISSMMPSDPEDM